jgi:ABC-type multidrug transport system ATPase subunit
VDSHDIFCTVRDAVEFSAMLRLPPTFTAAQKRAKADIIIKKLGLEVVADELIGDVSTGGISPEMRKKVTIALELVMEPGILFLDEPTTGLDSPSALSVMNAVEELSKNISVLCTIHQPSADVFHKFNYMLLLQKRGTVAYFGPTTDMLAYFEGVNPNFLNR